jgi:hypothetical protein
LRPCNNLYVGILKRSGTVDYISINGDTKFEENSFYNKKSNVVIYYNSYKENSEFYRISLIIFSVAVFIFTICMLVKKTKKY